MFFLREEDLNSEQMAAVTAEGNVFLIACPGSGKTRTLTYKIAYELSRLTSDKQFVVAITYTHRAADEIHERIEKIGVDTKQLWIGTIHSFCLEWILKPYFIYKPEIQNGFRVIDPYERETLLTDLCSPYKNPSITHFDCEYYFTKDGYIMSCSDSRKVSSVKAVLQSYFTKLYQNQQVDFELILYYAWNLVSEQPSISFVLSKLFSFLLIDEYQDTKDIQYSIVAAILKAGQGSTGVFIVGDPNQAIFQTLGGFAMSAANFSAISGVKFHEISLSKNYRSSERLITYFGNYKVHDSNIVSAAKDKKYPSLVSYNTQVTLDGLENELVRLITFNVEVAGIDPNEICIIAPWWVHLASLTRRLVSRLPNYEFNGPGMVPFSRNIDNFWYKLAKIVLTEPSPSIYITRLRWAGDILTSMRDAGINTDGLTRKLFLKKCNSITLSESDGLSYLQKFFELVFSSLNIDFMSFTVLKEHHEAFFNDSQARIQRLKKEGTDSISDIATFKKVFSPRTGITISTIHGIKGAEYDTVISYALLDGMVPHFSDKEKHESALRLLYVIGSRARKNLHLISERMRNSARGDEYQPTPQLAACTFNYDIVP